MKKIGIDVDGVLRDFMTATGNVFRANYPKHITDEIPYNYDFPHIKMPLKQKFNVIFNEYPEDVFLKAKPYPEAIAQFKSLKDWTNKKNIKLVCATSQEEKLIYLTYMWLGKYNFTFEELHITKNKGAIGLDYIIDDAESNYENWLENGNPEENFFLMSRSWNQNTEASNRINNLTDIIEIINKI